MAQTIQILKIIFFFLNRQTAKQKPVIDSEQTQSVNKIFDTIFF